MEMGIAVLAIQETKRARADLEDWTFAGDTLRGWRYIGVGMKRRAERGVGFLIAPWVEVLEIYEPSDIARGRLLAIRLSVAGLRLKAVNWYAPHEGLSDSMKDAFYAGLNTLSSQLD